MCFLPLGCLKAITSIGAVISIVISFVLLGVTIYANVYKKKVIDQASQGTLNQGLVFAYIASIVFLLLGISGLYGSLKTGKDKKGNKCLLGLYTIGVIVFFFLFLGGTILFFLAPKAIFFENCDSGGSQSLNNQLFTKSKQVSQRFCKDECQCYIDKNNVQLWGALSLAGYKNYSLTDSSLPTRYQQCPKYNASLQDKTVLVLAALEQLLGCGGWCESDIPKFYRFTNINGCASADCLTSLPGCYQTFKDFMFTKGDTMAIVCLAACVICLLNIMTVCCICCHPTKSGKRKNFYARMIDTDKD